MGSGPGIWIQKIFFFFFFFFLSLSRYFRLHSPPASLPIQVPR